MSAGRLRVAGPVMVATNADRVTGTVIDVEARPVMATPAAGVANSLRRPLLQLSNSSLKGEMVTLTNME